MDKVIKNYRTPHTKRFYDFNEIVDMGLFTRSTLNRIIALPNFPAVNPTGRKWKIDFIALENAMKRGEVFKANVNNWN